MRVRSLLWPPLPVSVDVLVGKSPAKAPSPKPSPRSTSPHTAQGYTGSLHYSPPVAIHSPSAQGHTRPRPPGPPQVRRKRVQRNCGRGLLSYADYFVSRKPPNIRKNASQPFEGEKHASLFLFFLSLSLASPHLYRAKSIYFILILAPVFPLKTLCLNPTRGKISRLLRYVHSPPVPYRIHVYAVSLRKLRAAYSKSWRHQMSFRGGSWPLGREGPRKVWKLDIGVRRWWRRKR